MSDGNAPVSKRAFHGRSVQLQRLCTAITDCHHSTPSWTESGQIVVRSENIKRGKISLKDPSYTDQASFKERISRSVPEPGDLIVTREAPMGEVGMIPTGVQCCLGQRLVLVKPDPSRIDRHYLLYAMQSEFVQKQIGASDETGSTVSNLRIPALRELEIPLLARAEEIGAVLAALDAKIDLNNRINAELEALAKTIYDYWFVQFDFPDAHGRPYKSSGGAMVWNDALKREIPAGWEVKSLWNIATYTNGLAMQKFRPKGSEFLRVIKIKEMSDGFSPDTERASPTIADRFIVNDGDILFSWSATLAVQIWTRGRGALNQHIFKVTSEKYPTSFVYFQLTGYLDHFKMMAEKRKTTMGHITLDHLRQSFVVIPPASLVERLDESLRPILDQYVGLNKQSQKLVELRDWLLPLLMNGQVRVA